MAELISSINDFVWGIPLIALLVGTGIYLTIRLRFYPWRNLWYALRQVFASRKGNDKDKGDISPFQSLMTALAATVGTGNIVGVATAMVLGGPGAIVWMWLTALFGLSTKYAESTLSVKYRVQNEQGEMAGGPMYVLERGFPYKKLGKILAVLFAVFTVGASFGIGNMTQANAISSALFSAFSFPQWIVGIVLVVVVGLVLIGGIQSIGKVCEVIVSVMAFFYILFGLFAIVMNLGQVLPGLREIFHMAFSIQAVAGGVGGTVTANILSAVRWGVSRGVFCNESGLGSAPIAAAAARTDSPSQQGYINMTGTFFDTIVICTITALVIASSGFYGTLDEAGEVLSGVALTSASFSGSFGPAGIWIVSISLVLFAFSTILGWEYYGETALGYLFPGRTASIIYRVIFSLVIFIGATQALQVVWDLSDIMNGLMAIPNLISLIVLAKVVQNECFSFQKTIDAQKKKKQTK